MSFWKEGAKIWYAFLSLLIFCISNISVNFFAYSYSQSLSQMISCLTSSKIESWEINKMHISHLKISQILDFELILQAYFCEK